MSKIFVSHSSKDKPLVDALVDLLVRGSDIPGDSFFCSSLPGTDIPPGADFLREILVNIDNSNLVVLVLSPNYRASEFCFAELGITWYLRDRGERKVRVFPLIVPPLSQTDASAVFQVTQSGLIDDKGWLDKLRDACVWAIGSSSKNTDLWNYKKDNFLYQLSDLLDKLPKPNLVSVADHERVKSNLRMARKELAEKDAEIKRLTEYASQLEKLKDKAEVAKTKLDSLGETEQFDELRWKVIIALRRLPKVVQQALYYNQKEQPFPYDGREELIEAEQATDDGYFEKRWYGSADQDYFIRERRKDVRVALDAIGELSAFLNKASLDFDNAYYDKHGDEPSLLLKPFWDTYIFSEL